MERILIEFYSQRTPENLISLLKENYQGVYFFHNKGKDAPDGKAKKQLTEVVQEIFNFPPCFYSVSGQGIEAVLTRLSSVLKPGKEYVIDITGGSEVFLAAAGIFLAQNPSISLTLHRYDVKSGTKLFSYPTENAAPLPFPKHLSVPQMLSLNGTPPLSAPRFAFSYGTLRNEILRLWDAVSPYPKEWNHFCSIPCTVQKENDSYFQKCMDSKNFHQKSYRLIAEKLSAAGIMENTSYVDQSSCSYMEFNLKVPKEAQFLYDKAGNLLEMYTALAAFDAGVFHDIRVGVTLDWNGIPAPHWKPDPRNEIDLVLMHHDLPVLASCKNTAPQNEYLYEIMTMARHYGGHFAKAMMLSTGFASPTVRERAKEMGIILIDGIRKKSFEELVALFRKYFS